MYMKPKQSLSISFRIQSIQVRHHIYCLILCNQNICIFHLDKDGYLNFLNILSARFLKSSSHKVIENKNLRFHFEYMCNYNLNLDTKVFLQVYLYFSHQTNLASKINKSDNHILMKNQFPKYILCNCTFKLNIKINNMNSLDLI